MEFKTLKGLALEGIKRQENHSDKSGVKFAVTKKTLMRKALFEGLNALLHS